MNALVFFLDFENKESVSRANCRPSRRAFRGPARRPTPEPTDETAVASISPFLLLLPVRPLPVFAAELRARLNRFPAGAERARVVAMLVTAESEIALRGRK